LNNKHYYVILFVIGTTALRQISVW